MAWDMASLIMWSLVRRVIMSLKILGFSTLASYWKWNSSVSKSLSSSGRVMSGSIVVRIAAFCERIECLEEGVLAVELKVRSARRSFSWFGVKFQRTATP